jgi:hypothetical protein
MASCCQTSSRSHHSTIAGGSGLRLIAVIVVGAAVLAGCDPLQGSGTGTPPDPSKYIQVDDASHTAIVTLIAGYPATDYQFNYNGYGNGSLILKVPAGWTITVQCENRGTIAYSCAVVAGGGDTIPLDPGWSTPNPRAGLQPGESASFAFTPQQPGAYRIASLVAGTEASGTWADLQVVGGGRPTLTAAQP